MDSIMEEEVEESRVDAEVVENGWTDGNTSISAKGDRGDVGEEEVVEGKKIRESRESRRKRKEREAAGDLVEDTEAKEERKKRRDEKEKHRTKDLDENERRDHRDSRDKKDARRKKEKESRERKEKREDRHGSDRDSRVKDESKDLDPRDTSDRRERREKRAGRKESIDVDSHGRGIGDSEKSSAVDKTVGEKDESALIRQLKSAYEDDEQEEGEILDEDSGPAKEFESGEICTREEIVKRDGDQNEGRTTEKSYRESPLLGKGERRESGSGKVDKTAKNSSNALQSMRGIAEAYDSESQGLEEKPVAVVDTRSENLHYEKNLENGRGRSEGPEYDGRSGSEKTKGMGKSDAKKDTMGPPEQRGSEAKEKKNLKTGETRSRHEGPRRGSLGIEVGHNHHMDIELPDAQLKSKHNRNPPSPAEDLRASGKRSSDGRRRRSPTPEDRNGSSRDRHYRRGRSRSRDTDNHKHIERGRSRSLESGKEREVVQKRTLSPEVVRSHVRGRSRSRETDRDKRTVADLQDRKKRSWSPDDSYERRHPRDSHEHLDRGKRSRSRESGRLKTSSRANSVDRRRRSRSRESLRERRIGTEWENSKRAESTERRLRSRSRESSHRRIDDREGSRHGEGHERSRGSRSKVVSRSYKGEDRDSRRVEDGAYRNGREDRHHRDNRHFDNSRESMYKMDRDREKNGTSSDEWKRGHRTPQAKDDQQSAKASLVESTMEEENQEEYQERVALQLAAQEEDDPEKIKEESRRRRQAILEKFKRQQQQKAAEEQKANGSGKPDVQDHPADQSNRNAVGATTAAKLEPVPSERELSLGKGALQNGALPKQTVADGGLGAGSPKSERSADMFCDDIFGESPAGGRRLGKGDGLALDTSGLNDNWDDAEGYYCFRIGEILDGRYEVASSHGRGVFSTVVRARDLKAGRGEPEEVAIKIIRNNETMFKAGQQELVILKKLAGADPENKRHCVRLLSSFEYRSHLCLVFESLHMNLREILKKFGRNIGINLNAVRAYAKQLFIALKHLKNCGVLHCDIKPDNMLVNEAKNVLKLCDFGSAMFAGENEITPYLVSRFYRAPEIILGLPYDHALDIWSVGCCLYELYTGKMLFPGHTNNDMLRLHMELKGPFPKKMLKKAAFADQHFDQDFNFCAIEEDPVTKKTIKRILANVRPKDMGILVSSSGSVDEDSKLQASFKDLLEKIFILDPDKRLTVSQALNHAFISGK